MVQGPRCRRLVILKSSSTVGDPLRLSFRNTLKRTIWMSFRGQINLLNDNTRTKSRKFLACSGNEGFVFRLGCLFEKIWTIFRTNLLCLSSKPLCNSVYTEWNRQNAKSSVDCARFFLMICWHSFTLHEPKFVILSLTSCVVFSHKSFLKEIFFLVSSASCLLKAIHKLKKHNICL